MKANVIDIEAAQLGQMLHQRPPQAHKGTMGHALLVSGSRGMAGATILASEACMRSGIGKLSIHTASSNFAILQISVPEAILTLDRNNERVTECKDIKPYDAVGIGPGMGTDRETGIAMKGYLQGMNKPLVIDADGINLLALHPEWLSLLPANTILTPHVGEADRLLGFVRDEADRLTKAENFVRDRRVYMVLKGHPTLIFTPSGEVFSLNVGNPGMATAGSGDVLTGLITGLLTQGYDPKEAALLGVWLHGTAGDFAAGEMGEECLLARDIIHHLPEAFKTIRNS